MKKRMKRHAVIQPLDKPFRFIPLTQGKVAIVDIEDFQWLSRWNWCAAWSKHTCSFYAMRTETKPIRTTLRMHREILGCKKGEEGDHWNHDTLDDRRENLRKCTRGQNMHNRRIQGSNTSGFTGVHWKKNSRKWQARICINLHRKNLGLFGSAEEAARAYDTAAKIHHGEFACLNFP